MSRYSSFKGARHTRISGNTQFNQAQSITNIHNYGGNGSVSPQQGNRRQMPIEHKLREYDPEEVILRKEVSSETLEITIDQSPWGTNNPFQVCVAPACSKFKMQKKVYTAEIVHLGDRLFTVYEFRPENEEDEGTLKMIWERIAKVSSEKSLWLPQHFGVVRTNLPMLIVHDELVNGEAYLNEYMHNPIIYHYLWYTYGASFDALDNGNSLAKYSIPLLGTWRNWVWNLKTCSWHYDPLSIALLESTQEDESHFPIRDWLTPLPQHTRPELQPQQIVAFFDEHLGDFLHTVASTGNTQHVDGLADFAPHGLLTFGSVVNCKSGTLGHFPVTPSPEWYYWPHTMQTNVDVTYSNSVPSRYDLTFCKTTWPSQADLHFSLCLPQDIRDLFRAAYLSQALGFYDDHDNPSHDLVFIDEVGFSLIGTFYQDPSTHSPPAYLFVPPIHITSFNDMPCIKYPSSDSLFYWSSDPNGNNTIPAEIWEQYGIPELKVEMWIGSFWNPVDYKSTQEYFQLKCYNPDGQQYAQDHNYPKLIQGDPHDLRIVECDKPPEVTPPGHSRLTSPSTFSLVKAPTEIDKMKSKMQAKQEMETKSNFLGWITKGFLKKSDSDTTPAAKDARHSENLETDSDAWITVGKEDC